MRLCLVISANCCKLILGAFLPVLIVCILYIIIVIGQHTSTLAFNISDIIVLNGKFTECIKNSMKPLSTYSNMNAVHMYVVLLYLKEEKVSSLSTIKFKLRDYE